MSVIRPGKGRVKPDSHATAATPATSAARTRRRSRRHFLRATAPGFGPAGAAERRRNLVQVQAVAFRATGFSRSYMNGLEQRKSFPASLTGIFINWHWHSPPIGLLQPIYVYTLYQSPPDGFKRWTSSPVSFAQTVALTGRKEGERWC